MSDPVVTINIAKGEPCVRHEDITITLVLNKSQVDRHLDNLNLIHQDCVLRPVEEGDTLRVSYGIWISYFGRVVECLTAVEKILDDPGVVREAHMIELKHGRSLLLDVQRKLERVMAKL